MKTIAHTKGKDSTHATPRKQLWDNWHVIFLHVFLLNFKSLLRAKDHTANCIFGKI